MKVLGFEDCECAFEELEYEILEGGLGWEERLVIVPPQPPHVD